jgi:hypothetical protein
MRLSFLLFAACTAHLLHAQTPFFVTAQQGDKTIPISQGLINISSTAIGKATSVRITVYYQGTGQATVAAPQLSGSSVFGISEVGSFPSTLTSNSSVAFTVTYTPRAPDPALGQLHVPVSELRADSTVVNGSLSFTVAGGAPSLTVSYALGTDNNAFPLAAGGAIAFPQTGLQASSTATITITNSGSSAGVVEGIAISSGAFQLSGLPLVPTTIPPAGSLRFGVRFVPQTLGDSAGQLTLALPQGSFVVNLVGTGVGSSIGYELILPEQTTQIRPGETLRLPDTMLEAAATALVRVKNGGNADAQITAITVTGAGFSITSAPALPATLTPAQSLTFTLTFTPTQGGAANGSLRIGNDSFLLSASGLAKRLTVSYGGAELPATGATVRLPAVQIGNSSRATITVKNAGTAPAVVRAVQFNRTTAELALADLPELPQQLDPEAAFSFTVVFTPRTVDVLSNALAIDDRTVTVSGAGTPPPALPAYRFEGASGTQEPMQQPAVSLRLEEPYPLPIVGTLTLAPTSEVFATDPSVQFAVGGRAVAFQIPANTTQAVFANGATSIRFQTGSVASSIVLTPAFAMQSGYDLTPATPEPLTLRVTTSPPRIMQMQVVAQGQSGFTLAITGMTTTRSINQLSFKLQPAAGATLAATDITLDVRSAFDLWFQSPQSQAFGSLFSFSIPFSLTLPTPAGPLSQYVESVSATLVNGEGSSSPSSVNLR